MTNRSFNADDPIAYFITWTCYGTWLSGDERGWHEWGKGGLQPANVFLKSAAETKMKETEFLLSKDDRRIVETTVAEHCRIRQWILHKVNSRSNHVHVVVTAPGYAPETVRDQLKAWCTRKLKPHYHVRKQFWTEGASCRSINHECDLDSVIEYAGDTQDRKYRDYQHEAPASESGAAARPDVQHDGRRIESNSDET